MLEGSALRKRYRGREVLRGVDLCLRRGESVALLGPNGAGKTTCFYLLCGLLDADGGRVRLKGRDVTGMSMFRRARLGLGYLPQEASVFRGLSVADNLRVVLQRRRLPARERERRLDAILGEFSIDHLRKARAEALSGGERRRLEIARALAAEPDFILLDEPLAGVDPIAVDEIRDLIARLKGKGLGVLVTDHNVRETLGMVDRAYILSEGTILHEGSPGEIVAHEEVRRVYLGTGFRA